MIYLDSFTPVAGDCTQGFNVYGYKSTNPYDFVGEVLNQFPHDWGDFSLHFLDFRYGLSAFDLVVDYCDRCTKKDIPLIWKSLKIDKILSSGGYSRMDYIIYIS